MGLEPQHDQLAQRAGAGAAERAGAGVLAQLDRRLRPDHAGRAHAAADRDGADHGLRHLQAGGRGLVPLVPRQPWRRRAQRALSRPDLAQDPARRRHHRLCRRYLPCGGQGRALHLLPARRRGSADDVYARCHPRHHRTDGSAGGPAERARQLQHRRHELYAGADRRGHPRAGAGLPDPLRAGLSPGDRARLAGFDRRRGRARGLGLARAVRAARDGGRHAGQPEGELACLSRYGAALPPMLLSMAMRMPSLPTATGPVRPTRSPPCGKALPLAEIRASSMTWRWPESRWSGASPWHRPA
ncbi:protein of unknown function (plasmid) [Cupriavidus taiwanensis]|nr:protein of unknown function [Cupriavidus taiwanensis]